MHDGKQVVTILNAARCTYDGLFHHTVGRGVYTKVYPSTDLPTKPRGGFFSHREELQERSGGTSRLR